MSQENINSTLDVRNPKIVELMIPKKLGKYTLEKLILETEKSIVLSSNDPVSNQKVAIKCIPIEYFNSNPEQVQIMQTLNDPNIMKILNSFQYPQQNPRFFAIVMPRAINDLIDYTAIINLEIPEPIVCKIMRDSLTAVNTLHSNNIWHRNLKLDNILIMEETRQGPKVVITDFCHSIVVNAPTFNGPAVGTIQYAAPELLEAAPDNSVVEHTQIRFKANVEYSNKIDIYSMGVVMYALLYGMLPLYKSDSAGLNKEIDFYSPMCVTVSAEAIDLARIMLDSDPNQRPSAQEALDHPFFQLYPNDQTREDDIIGQIFNALD